MNRKNENFVDLLTFEDKVNIAKDVMGDSVENFIVKGGKVPSNELHFIKSNDILNLEKVVFYDFKAFAITYDDKQQSKVYQQMIEKQYSDQFTSSLRDALFKKAGKEYATRLCSYESLEDFININTRKNEDVSDMNSYVDLCKEGK